MKIPTFTDFVATNLISAQYLRDTSSFAAGDATIYSNSPVRINLLSNKQINNA